MKGSYGKTKTEEWKLFGVESQSKDVIKQKSPEKNREEQDKPKAARQDKSAPRRSRTS